MDDTHNTTETVTLRVVTTPIAGGDRYAVAIEVEAPGHHLRVTAPEGDMTLFRRDSRERPGVVSEWKFGDGNGRVRVQAMQSARMEGPDTFVATITLDPACELLHVLRVLDSGGWRLTGDAAMEARWNAGESLEPGDFALAAVAPEAPHAEPETPHTTPEAPHATPEPAHAEAADPAHVEPSPVPETPAPVETPEMPEPFSPPQSGQ